MTEPLITPTDLRARLTFEQGTTDDELTVYINEAHSKIVLALGFDYPRRIQVVTLDATHDPILVLPGAGARQILSVVENGVTLSSGGYELDPADGRFLRRLDSNNKSQNWVHGDRTVVVRYNPAAPPAALKAAELDETVYGFRRAQAGGEDRISPSGARIPWRQGLSGETMVIVDALKRGGGVGVW